MLNKNRTHAAFLNSYAPQDDGLYDDWKSPNAKLKAIYAIVVIILAIAMLVVLVLVANRAALLIGYHEWRMQRAHQRPYSDPVVRPDGLVSHESDEDFADYEYHRDRLVALGALRRIEFRFTRLRTGTTEYRTMTRLMLSRQCPAHLDFVSEVPSKPQLVKMTIWCQADDVSEWEAFLKLHDASAK